MQVGEEGTWSTVSAGERHTCGVKTDGTLFCWGTSGWWWRVGGEAYVSVGWVNGNCMYVCVGGFRIV